MLVARDDSFCHFCVLVKEQRQQPIKKTALTFGDRDRTNHERLENENRLKVTTKALILLGYLYKTH